MKHASIISINQTIVTAAKKYPRLIVGIDGYTGIGKTTLLTKLAAKNKDIISVHRDDFSVSRISLERLLNKAKDKSRVFELEMLNIKKIQTLVKKFRQNQTKKYTVNTYNSNSGRIDCPKTYDLSKNILIIEGIFLFHPGLFEKIFNLKIWVDGDIKQADQRRIEREKAKWGSDYYPETKPNSYFMLVRTAFNHYVKKYQPQKKSDLVVYSD